MALTVAGVLAAQLLTGIPSDSLPLQSSEAALHGNLMPAGNGMPPPLSSPVGLTAPRVLRVHASTTPVHEAFPLAAPFVHAVALETTMRVIEAILWPQPFAEFSSWVLSERYIRAVTSPPVFDPHAAPFEWDHDHWFINIVGHGLFGSELYLRMRTCGFDPLASVAFAATASAVWEYGFESSGTRPSALDLVYTPVIGALLGEARYQLWQIAGRLVLPERAVLRAIVDPLGEIERSARLFGC